MRGVRGDMGLHKTAYALVVVGALNWGLVGLLNFNLVSALFGTWPMLEKVIYILVGLSAIYEGMIHMSYCKYCSTEMRETANMPMNNK